MQGIELTPCTLESTFPAAAAAVDRRAGVKGDPITVTTVVTVTTSPGLQKNLP